MNDPAPTPARQALDDQLGAFLRDRGLQGYLACSHCDANLRKAAEEYDGFVVMWPTVQNGEDVAKYVIAKVAEPPQERSE
jgi:hypothetical protein